MNEKTLKDSFSLITDIISEIRKDIVSQLDKKLEDYIKKNLMQLGFEFTSQIEFYDFCKKRITRVYSVNDPHHYDFYLDLKKENQGILIGWYSDKIEIIKEENKFTAVIGRD